MKHQHTNRERNAAVILSLSVLAAKITGMIVILMLADSVRKYVPTNTVFGQIDLRGKFTFDIHTKLSKTSYPNLYDKKFLQLLNQAQEAVCDNNGFVSTIWDHISDLMKNVTELFIYSYPFYGFFADDNKRARY